MTRARPPVTGSPELPPPNAEDETLLALVYYPVEGEGLLAEKLGELVKELHCPPDRLAAVEEALSTPQGKQALRSKSEEILRSWPKQLRHRISQLFDKPFDQTGANALRAEFDQASQDERARWGAYVRLVMAAGMLDVGYHKHSRSLARQAWWEGLRDHTVDVSLQCPDCARPAGAAVRPSADHVVDWYFCCPQCRFEEKISTRSYPEMPRDGQDNESRLRKWLLENPAVTGAGAYSQRLRSAKLVQLEALTQDIDASIVLEMQAHLRYATAQVANSCRHGRAMNDTLWTFRLYANCCTELLDNVRNGVAPTLQDRPDRYGVLRSNIDEVVDGVLFRELELVNVDAAHFAHHWRPAFDARVGKLRQAVHSGDAVEAALQGAMLVHDCRKFGLTTPRAIKVRLPAGTLPRPRPIEAPQTDRLLDVPVAELAEFLAQTLSSGLVRIDRDQMVDVLRRFMASRRSR